MFRRGILYQVTVRKGRAFQLDATGPPLRVSTQNVLRGWRGEAFTTSIQVFSVGPRVPTLLLTRGRLEFFGHWDKREF